MNQGTYEELAGVPITPEDRRPAVTAAIARAQVHLETLLGYTLDPDAAAESQWDSGIEGDDAIWRVFPVRYTDRFWHIDANREVRSIRLIWPDGTSDLVDAKEYRSTGRISSYLETFVWQLPSVINDFRNRLWTDCLVAVDADWLGIAPTDADAQFLPRDLMRVWADMVTFEADDRRDIRSESLGSRSYSRFEKKNPAEDAGNLTVIRRYAGPKGSVSAGLPL